jgi:hypothetical protein
MYSMRPQAANIDVAGMIKGIKAAVRSYRIVSYRGVGFIRRFYLCADRQQQQQQQHEMNC